VFDCSATGISCFVPDAVVLWWMHCWSRKDCTSFALAWPLGSNLHAYSSYLWALAKAMVLPKASCSDSFERSVSPCGWRYPVTSHVEIRTCRMSAHSSIDWYAIGGRSLLGLLPPCLCMKFNALLLMVLPFLEAAIAMRESLSICSNIPASVSSCSRAEHRAYQSSVFGVRP
jgi:hypothetical protein